LNRRGSPVMIACREMGREEIMLRVRFRTPDANTQFAVGRSQPDRIYDTVGAPAVFQVCSGAMPPKQQQESAPPGMVRRKSRWRPGFYRANLPSTSRRAHTLPRLQGPKHSRHSQADSARTEDTFKMGWAPMLLAAGGWAWWGWSEGRRKRGMKAGGVESRGAAGRDCCRPACACRTTCRVRGRCG